MKKFFLLISIFAILHTQAQITFEKTYETTDFRSLAQTPDSGYCLVGDYYNYSTDKQTGFIIRTDKYGETLWHKEFAFSNYTYCPSITTTPDSAFVVAGTSIINDNEMYIMKIDKNGDSIWCKTYSFIDVACIYKIITTSDGGFAFTGTGFELSDSFYANFGFLLRCNQFGDTLFYQRLYDNETNTYESFFSLINCNDNGFALCGYSSDTTTASLDAPLWVNVTRLDSMGEIVFSREYKIASGDQNYCGNDLCQDNQGNLVVCASRTYSPSSLAPTWLIKLNEWGDTLFTKTVALDGYVGGHQTIFNAGASGFVVGTHMVVYPNAYAALFKVDTTFNLTWQSTFDGLNFARFWNAIATTDGGYTILGTTYDLNNQPYGYLAKTDEDGLITGIGETLTGRKPVPYAIEPNPITGQTISLRAYEGFKGPLHFEVLASTGQCVHKGIISPGVGNTLTTLQLPGVAKGLYLLVLQPHNSTMAGTTLKLLVN